MNTLRFIFTMAILCGAAAGFLSFLNGKTSRVIEANRKGEAVKAVMDKVLRGRYTDIKLNSNPDSIFIVAKVIDKETGKEKEVKFIDAFNDDGRLVVQVVENTSYIGYSGPIRILVGVDSLGKVIGTAVLSHTETPGLGDQMLLEWFQKQFLGLSVESGDIKITKFGGNIESISGASITSNAFTSALNEALTLANARITGKSISDSSSTDDSTEVQ